jgi:hypothetical protein
MENMLIPAFGLCERKLGKILGSDVDSNEFRILREEYLFMF